MNQSLSSILAYSEGKFVKRPEFEQLVERLYPATENAGIAPSGSPPPPIYLHGDFGIGKSWLAYHFCSQSPDTLPARTPSKPDNNRLLVSLVTAPPSSPLSDTIRFIPIPTPDDTQAITEQIREMLRWLAEKLAISVAPSGSASELIYRITRDLSAQSRPLILLVDGLSEVPDSLLVELESYLLAPLAALPQVRLVLVEPSSYPWRFPTLRVDGETIAVRPFEEKQVVEQIAKLMDPPLLLDAVTLEQIVEFGQCVPLHTACLTAEVVDKGLKEGLQHGLDAIIHHILRNVPAARQTRVRSYMEALCIRDDGFHETMIVPLLAQHPDSGVIEEGTIRDLKQARDIRNELFDAGLITSKGALYEMEKPTRHVFQRYLESYKRTVWTALHKAALAFFQDWATKVGDNHRVYYEKRAQDHQAILEKALPGQS